MEEHEEIDDDIPTGDGLDKNSAQLLLIKEMNNLIMVANVKRVRRSKGRTPLAPMLKGRRNLQQAVSMARKRGGYERLLKNAGF